ncbi:MAG: hypothetical protein LBH77_01595 [Tannerella sp.]|nr:hypothetical protein [Tannerella sp.]
MEISFSRNYSSQIRKDFLQSNHSRKKVICSQPYPAPFLHTVRRVTKTTHKKRPGARPLRRSTTKITDYLINDYPKESGMRRTTQDRHPSPDRIPLTTLNNSRVNVRERNKSAGPSSVETVTHPSTSTDPTA